MTGKTGADEIRRRVRMHYPHLMPRIEDMLIVLPPKPESDLRVREEEGKGDREQIDVDLSQVPKILFERFGMRIVNHDGTL
jgi:hypothetical protein